MPVDTKHPEYSAMQALWAKCRDASGGQECVHRAGVAYLPKLLEQQQTEYDAYKGRALFYNATGRTVDGLSGLVFRRPPKFELPASVEYLLDDADTAGTPLQAFCERAVEELLKVGRFGLLVDFPVVQQARTLAEEAALGARPYLTRYRAEDIINWRTERIAGRMQTTLVVLQEKHAEGGDGFSQEFVDQLRALRLMEGRYVVEIYRRKKDAGGMMGEWVLADTLVPLLAGAPLTFIPFLFCNPMGVGEHLVNPPILDLANVNLSHYRSTADYEHGLHFTGLPTPVVSGHTFDTGQEFALGSTRVQAFTNPSAKAYFMEFTGTGLASLSKRLEEKEAMMAALGARMLAAEKRAAEAAETAAIHRSGESSVLASLANAAGTAISKALGWCLLWARVEGEAKVELNTDYLPAGMTAQELTALVGAWQAGAISHETFYDNLVRGEIAQQDVDFETEKERLEAEGPALGALGADLDPATGLPIQREKPAAGSAA